MTFKISQTDQNAGNNSIQYTSTNQGTQPSIKIMHASWLVMLAFDAWYILNMSIISIIPHDQQIYMTELQLISYP